MTMFIVDFNPIAIDLGFISIRWYALAYIIGFIGGRYWIVRTINQAVKHGLKPACTIKDVDDFLGWAVIGVIIGGRLGYTLLWYPEYYIANPVDIIKIWQGGMAFHGGLLGVIIAALLFCRKRQIALFNFGDYLAIAIPIGLGFGRVSNFINGELWGKVTNVSWAVIFPNIDNQPRHPSPLYEAVLEGLILFIMINIIYKLAMRRRIHGVAMSCFLILYGIMRYIAELFRDDPLNPFITFLTTGQLYSIPMVIIGLILLHRAYRHHS